jgi:tetratricopeptide (TPR) repeat protein
MLAFLFFSLTLIAGQLSPALLWIQGRNSIEGRVTTADNRPIDNIRVTLQSESYGTLATTYLDGAGRYQFRGIRPGTFYVLCEAPGTDFERQTQRLEVGNPFSRTGGAEVYRVDFVLTRPKSAHSNTPGSGVVFYQQVPDDAKAEYQRGLKRLDSNDFEAAASAIKHAIEIFPDYYAALELLGSEYVKREDYRTALPLLTHAVEVNKDGTQSFYMLGVALVELKQRHEGIAALHRAVELNPNSINANMRLGLELAKDEQAHDEAIKVLRKASQLAGNRVPQVYLALASLYSKNGQYGEAADSMESYLHLIPESEAAQREKIKALIQQLRQKAQTASQRK